MDVASSDCGAYSHDGHCYDNYRPNNSCCPRRSLERISPRMLPQLPHDLFDVIERDFGLQWTPGDRENLWHGLLDFKLERVKPAPWDLSEDEAKALLAASNAFRVCQHGRGAGGSTPAPVCR